MRLVFPLFLLALISGNCALTGAEGPPTSTSLEQIFSHAFNSLVSSGSWFNLYGTIPRVLKDSYCIGNANSWPVPDVDDASDLHKVLDSGVFKCGIVQDLKVQSSTGELLIGPGNTSDSVSGVTVDWWNELAKEVSSSMGSSVEIAWKLFPTSQDVFDAVYNGEADAACAIFAADGVWTRPQSDDQIARGLAFSMQTCTDLLEEFHLYTLAADDNDIKSFSSLIDAINLGLIDTICVSGSPGGGYETTCQNTLNEYSTSDTAACKGVKNDGFAMLRAGDCEAVWFGYPDDDIASYNTFPSPTFFLPVSFFRQQDLPKADPFVSDKTTLELAVTRSFNTLVASGDWTSIIGSLPNVRPTSQCTGRVGSWPLPPAVLGSDLQAVLKRGSLRCGYTQDQIFSTGTNGTVIDTTGAGVKGAVPLFWEALLGVMGRAYNTTLNLEWVLNETSQDAFDSLYSNAADVLCGYWVPAGTWRNPKGDLIARPLGFSMMQCASFLQISFVYTVVDSPISSFSELVDFIKSSSSDLTKICVPDDTTGGFVTACNSGLEQYVDVSKFECLAAPSNTSGFSQWAFQSLQDGVCVAVWDGTPSDRSLYNSFSQPSIFAPVSFFRSFDANNASAAPTTGAPTPDPSVPLGTNTPTATSRAARFPGILSVSPAAACFMLVMLLVS